MGGALSPHEGQLFIVATPIGNLEDISLRALQVLREVDIIACEDTRRTRKLLAHFQIKKPLISYFHPREKEKIPLLVRKLKQGQKVALVSDAGTPGLSDPGFLLLQAALEENIQIIPIPGPSAITTALMASGLPTHRFLFVGFPPPKKKAIERLLESLQKEKGTLVFFLPARKLSQFMNLVAETLGDRQMVIAREMTKVHEEFIRGKAKEIIARLEEISSKGEVTILIRGQKK
ncbi:MAG: 16S rRNA (cytidine(1402)-2'-O)-methyltransferase [Candidatus Aminicenantes bacterium 4484_214]|nr:MAG: 16S rRNA (cytidine(1402)-2'-O)-methyltransferase [Candidatus Aminicenantes bacterium 4484_214]RLE08932.1 MAG: 16S rRNA (cytidine(1402)-2'-O)-methyltransferase [Candidatus Aminicenantes bacterium]